MDINGCCRIVNLKIWIDYLIKEYPNLEINNDILPNKNTFKIGYTLLLYRWQNSG